MENRNGLKPVRVTVPVTRDVDFIVYVKDTENMDEILAALKEKDPSDWETDPCFYEHFGDVWKRVEDLITRENVKAVDEATAELEELKTSNGTQDKGTDN